MLLRNCLVVLLAVCAVGCGGAIKKEAVQEVTQSPKDAIQAALEQIKETGSSGSDLGAAMQHVEALKSTDAELAATLESGLAEIMSGASPDAAKAKAEELLKALGGG